MIVAAAGGHSPIEQFALKTVFPLKLFGLDISITNSTLFMMLTVGLICGFLYYAMRGAERVPGRMQSAAEMLYEFVASTVRDNLDDGKEGKRFFPLVFALFTFVLVCNLLGMIPGFFTVRAVGSVTVSIAAAGSDRDHLVCFAAGVAGSALVREHARRSHRFEDFCRVRCNHAECSVGLEGACGVAARADGRAERTRVAGCFPASLRVRRSYLCLSE
jgi:ATP synthase A chain